MLPRRSSPLPGPGWWGLFAPPLPNWGGARIQCGTRGRPKYAPTPKLQKTPSEQMTDLITGAERVFARGPPTGVQAVGQTWAVLHFFLFLFLFLFLIRPLQPFQSGQCTKESTPPTGITLSRLQARAEQIEHLPCPALAAPLFLRSSSQKNVGCCTDICMKISETMKVLPISRDWGCVFDASTGTAEPNPSCPRPNIRISCRAH